MTKQYVQTIGFGGPTPLAIIFWYEGEQRKYKTVCYDEQDVMTMYQRHITPSDFYNKLRPSVQLVDSKSAVEIAA